VDDRVHPSELIRLIGDPSRLFGVSEITHDNRGSPIFEVAQRGTSLFVPSVDDDIVALIQERLSRRPSEPIRRACNQNARHISPRPPGNVLARVLAH
jgi:hypothetical protein